MRHGDPIWRDRSRAAVGHLFAILLPLAGSAAAQDAQPPLVTPGLVTPGLVTPPPAAAALPTDAPSFTIATQTHTTIRPDFTSLQRHTVRIRIGQESAISGMGQQSIGFVDGMETLEIVEAFTEKAAGDVPVSSAPQPRRVPVDPATVITRDAASGLNAVYLRDSKTRTVIFPDIAVGDTLVYTTLRDVKQSNFENQFSYGAVYQRSLPWAGATHTFEAPKSLALRIKVSGEGLQHTPTTEGDTIRHRVVFVPPAKRTTEEGGAVAPVDREPTFSLTTFPDYEALGRAYWRDAAPMTAVTPDIQKLADEIARGLDGKRAEAIAIDRWMKRNVRYVAVYLGRQRWIPHSAQAVLTNKYGDCKDMVTLMSALLKARGIAVEHVLINLGTSYLLPELPPGAFNHAILRLPDFGVFADPTATLAGFGVLATQTYDKPVLLASETGARLFRTPPMRAEDHITTARTTARIAADGTVSGETLQTATGFFAVSARSSYLNAQGNGFEKAAENILSAMRTPGKGKFEATSPSELREPYVVKATFTLTDKLAMPLRGARRMPVGLPVHARPGSYLLGARSPERRLPFTCFGGTQVEEIDIEFAPELTMPRKPNPRTIETSVFAYKATYAIDGRTLKARREFVSRVKGQVCPADLEKELAEPFKSMIASMVSPLVFGNFGDNGPGDYAKSPKSEPGAAPATAPKGSKKAP